MTAKDDGLWDPVPPLAGLVPVTREDIRHMQSRVVQFHASAPLQPTALATVPKCKESFCRWLVVEAAAFASRAVAAPPPRLAGRALPQLPLTVGSTEGHVGGDREDTF